MRTHLKNVTGLLLLLAVLAMPGCNKEDKVFEPEGAITLNMLNEENGKTILANSDIFINKSNNFKGSLHLISEVGQVSNLGDKLSPRMTILSKEVAVIPGNAYQIFHPNSLVDFPSGIRAILKNSGYYQVHVKSLIQDNNKQTGAVVRYALVSPDGRSLPEVDYHVGECAYKGDVLTMEVSKDAECQLAPKSYEDVSSVFDLSHTGNKLTITLKQYANKVSGPYGDYYVYIRVKEVCTRVHIFIEG